MKAKELGMTLMIVCAIAGTSVARASRIERIERPTVWGASSSFTAGSPLSDSVLAWSGGSRAVVVGGAHQIKLALCI